MLTRPPRRRRTGALSPRQMAALAAINQRPRSCAELAAILGTSAEGAARTASSLVNRGKCHRVTTAGIVRYAVGKARS